MLRHALLGASTRLGAVAQPLCVQVGPCSTSFSIGVQQLWVARHSPPAATSGDHNNETALVLARNILVDTLGLVSAGGVAAEYVGGLGQGLRVGTPCAVQEAGEQRPEPGAVGAINHDPYGADRA